ncbi:MAG: hypothetical protein JOS17DRAFT_748224 [Linnemannia elongata]|nr:MAG: hypothetical protein JOS17DRAFT_748224 [Linnemannia elongata]
MTPFLAILYTDPPAFAFILLVDGMDGSLAVAIDIRAFFSSFGVCKKLAQMGVTPPQVGQKNEEKRKKKLVFDRSLRKRLNTNTKEGRSCVCMSYAYTYGVWCMRVD